MEEASDAATTKTRAASAEVSYLAFKNSVFSIEPFAIFTVKKVNEEDTDWGAYLGAKLAVGTTVALGRQKTE